MTADHIAGLKAALDTVDAAIGEAETDAARAGLWKPKAAITELIATAYKAKAAQEARPVVKAGKVLLPKKEAGDGG